MIPGESLSLLQFLYCRVVGIIPSPPLWEGREMITAEKRISFVPPTRDLVLQCSSPFTE